MNHFDDFYGSVFGKKWPSMREALLRRPKYVAVVNNYGDAEETSEYLTNRGIKVNYLFYFERLFSVIQAQNLIPGSYQMYICVFIKSINYYYLSRLSSTHNIGFA